MYDITSLSSFIQVKRWLNEVKEYCMFIRNFLSLRISILRVGNEIVNLLIFLAPDCSFMLIGNKVDLSPKFRAVSVDEATKFARENGCNFMETSAKDNINCAKAFQQFLQGIYLIQSVFLVSIDEINSTKKLISSPYGA